MSEIETSKMGAMYKGARVFLALCGVGLLSLSTSACGNTSKVAGATATTTSASSRSATVGQTGNSDTDRDHDGDSSGKGRYDSDDKSVLGFGHAANASNGQTIATLVRSYYAAAVAENGAKACSMLYSTYAESIPEDYGTSPPGPAYARGMTCTAVMTLYFKHFHGQIAVRFPKLKVSRVRLKERQGVAILSFGTLPEREIRVQREGHTWRVLGLIDNELQ